MTKKNALHKCEDHEHDEDAISFNDLSNVSFDDEMIDDMAGTVVEAYHQQVALALELTKMILEKNSAPMNEQAIFSIFEKSIDLISEKSPLKMLMEQDNS